MKSDPGKEIRKKSVTVGFLYESNKERLQLKSLNGNVGFDNLVSDKNLHRPGLALAGFVDIFAHQRVQMFGNTEIAYLEHLAPEARRGAFETLFKFAIPCIVVTSSHVLDASLLEMATAHRVAVVQTPYETTKFSFLLSDFLDDQFASQTLVHGSFVDVYGIGLLFVGRSGIGKSEIALDLVERGHRLVADDAVRVTKKGEAILIGTSTEVGKHFMEVRGLGIVDVRSIFGIRAARYQKRVELVVELEEWKIDEEYTRTGLDQGKTEILGVEVPLIKLPIFPGKNVTVIAEVIALDYLLKHYGYDPASEFSKRLQLAIEEKRRLRGATVLDYFEHDFE